MKINNYQEFINEEISKKQILTGALAGTLAIGGIGAGASYLRDRSSRPKEEISQVKKEIPSNFMINEKMLTIGNDFWITNKEGENFGKIEQRLLSFGKKFEYFDNTGKLDATAQEKLFSLYNIVYVKDGTGKDIGRVEQEILESFGNVLEGQNVYSIYDSNNNLIGKSKADLVITNNIEIYDDKDNLVARFHKPAIQFGDRWTCEINKSNIDNRLMIFIPAYISSKSSNSKSSKK
jgi:uncharacterized protein YxjI